MTHAIRNPIAPGIDPPTGPPIRFCRYITATPVEMAIKNCVKSNRLTRIRRPRARITAKPIMSAQLIWRKAMLGRFRGSRPDHRENERRWRVVSDTVLATDHCRESAGAL